jgi:tetratricopeptide (TPR) repeat protein
VVRIHVTRREQSAPIIMSPRQLPKLPLRLSFGKLDIRSSCITNMNKLLASFSIALFLFSISFAQTSDAALRRAMRLDNDQRGAGGKLPTLEAAEHLSRAEAYMANRLFPQAREHWQIFFDNYPNDPGMPKALFGTARSYMWERQYEKAVSWFEKLNGNTSKDGREGLAFKGASLVRLGKNLEAAKV